MKYIGEAQAGQLPSGRIGPGEKFAFRCHSQLACFNRCCHNLNLFVYPYDVLRLKQCLGICADQFIDQYVDIVMREDHFFPEVLLRMADSPAKPCVFLTAQGCGVYADRPHTCRYFPVERGAFFDASTGRTMPVYFFRPPAFCLGPTQERLWTIEEYTRQQEAGLHDRMTSRWADIWRLFQNNPWGADGIQGPKAKMAFMAVYNLDRFREFVFQSTFLQRYRIPPILISKMRKNDIELLAFGFEWINYFIGGQASRQIRPK